MAQEIQTIIRDDFDKEIIGDGKGQVVTITINNMQWVMDLREINYQNLLDAVRPWTSQVELRRVVQANRRVIPSKDDSAKIRAWARETGQVVGEKGLISNKVKEAYARAQAE